MDDVVRQVVDETNAIDRDIATLTEQIVRLREEESDAYRQLALLRLKDLQDAQLIDRLGAAEEQARRLLGDRSRISDQIDQQLATVEVELATANEALTRASAEAEAARRGLAEVEKRVLDALAETEAHRRQHTLAAEADAVARHATQKFEFSEKDCEEKKRLYEGDALFMYLWRRGYGTSEYRAGRIVRYGDAKVARLVGYSQARANYTMLQQIPQRLREHAERQRQRAAEEAARLQAMEQDALADPSCVDKKAVVDAAEEQLNAAEQQVDAVERKRRSLLDERAALSRGDDDQTNQALHVIMAAIRRQDLQTLREQALRTPLLEDDIVVDRIGDIENALRVASERLEKSKALQLDHRKRLQEVEVLRRDYRRGGFGNEQFDFRDRGALSVLLAEMLRGGLSRDGIWDQMRHRHRPPFPQPGGWGGRRGGGWPVPRFPGGFGGGRSSPSGGRSGGGFRTGGGF